MGWTDEQVEELKRLWSEGLTTGEIGKTLGVSKNAVVGKAHRLGLTGRPSPIRRADGDANATATAQTAPAVKKEAKKAGTTPKSGTKKATVQKEKVVTVNDLTNTSCRWPVGDPKSPDFHFCGKEALSGKPYCLEHCNEAYVMAKNVR